MRLLFCINCLLKNANTYDENKNNIFNTLNCVIMILKEDEIMNVHFGFSYIGCIFLIMLMVPNLIWTKHKPKDYEKYVGNENKLLLSFERIGQVLVTCFVLLFDDFNINEYSYQTILLLAAFLFMLLYEWFWIRYFKSEQTMKDYYGKLLGIPVPGAVLPIIAFILLALYRHNLFLLAAVILLGIGHIGIHLQHQKEAATL